MIIELKKPSYECKQIMTVPFELKSFKVDEDFFYFEGYLSTFGNEDRGGDVAEKGVFKESLKIHTPSLFWSHNPDEPLGVFDSLTEDDKGLYVKGRMPLEDDFVKNRIIPQIKIGSIKSMSIGYSVWGDDGAETINGVRHLKRVFLWEGSLVTIPMNDQANLKTKSAMPFQEEAPIADRQRPWDAVTAIGRVRDWAGAEDGGLEDPETQSKYKRAFLWYDEADRDLFAAYKLPIADIIDNTLTIIPRAIFAAAGALRGARGGVILPSNDKPRVINTIEKYYKKMGLDSPFGKSFRIDDFNSYEERVLEKLLRSGICMSEKNSKMLISCIKSGLGREVIEPAQREVDNGELKSILNSVKKFNNQFNG